MKSKERFRELQRILSNFVRETINYGSFVECGVKQGSASIIMAKQINRKGYLFDTWNNLPHFGKYDAFTESRRKKLRKRIRKGKDTYRECIDNLSSNNVLSMCKMIRGDICKTVPKFIKNKSMDLSVCMLHSDSDLYDPTETALQRFWPYIINGGIILIHDYDTKQWPGIKVCVDKFITDKKISFCTFDEDIACSALIMKDNNDEFKDDFNNLVSLIRGKIEK